MRLKILLIINFITSLIQYSSIITIFNDKKLETLEVIYRSAIKESLNLPLNTPNNNLLLTLGLSDVKTLANLNYI